MCPLVGIGTLPPLLSPASVPLPPNQRGAAQSPAGEGVGEFQFRNSDDWRKSLALCLLCAKTYKTTLQIIYNCAVHIQFQGVNCFRLIIRPKIKKLVAITETCFKDLTVHRPVGEGLAVGRPLTFLSTPAVMLTFVHRCLCMQSISFS